MEESKNHHSNTNQTENSKTALMRQFTDDGLPVFNDFLIKQKDKSKKQSCNNLVPKKDVNKL